MLGDSLRESLIGWWFRATRLRTGAGGPRYEEKFMPEAKCRRWCLDALRLLLEGLGERGLACVTLSELAAS